MRRLKFWLIEVPATVVSAWLWLYQGLLLILSIATFTGLLLLLAAWALGFRLT